MLIPKRVAHRKQHHPRRTGKAKGGTKVEFGDMVYKLRLLLMSQTDKLKQHVLL